MIFSDQMLIVICGATGILGGISGLVGSWLFLQRKSLFGDTVAHATFPGLTGIFLLTLSKNPYVLLLGGTISACIAVCIIHTIQHTTSLKKDTILGIILVSSFGIGTMLLSKIQSIPDAQQAGLTKYLLGNPATMLHQDLIIIGLTSLIVIATTIQYFRPYLYFLFDPIYAQSIQISTTVISWIMLMITTITIVAGLQTVGIILTSALLINPAASAYQWTKNFRTMTGLSIIFGTIATITGTVVSYNYHHIPAGPSIVIVASTITFCSLMLSPHGWIMSWYQTHSNQKNINDAQILSRFLLFNEGKTDPFYAHHIAALNAIQKNIPEKKLHQLQQQGYIESPQKNFWRLTRSGVACIKNHMKV